ncbi:hypothetical protein LZ30DRAFT_707046 [Colletotrichum cereale]|nr:hypothetical protein LZ30DRAFT_707046 [Colletotrichum cereale]
MSWASEVTFKSAEECAVVVAPMEVVVQALLRGLNIVTSYISSPRIQGRLVLGHGQQHLEVRLGAWSHDLA